MIKIDIIDDISKFDFNTHNLCVKLAKQAFVDEKVNENISLNLIIVTKSKIKKLNKERRNIDKVTDVLSFPNINFKRPAKFTSLSKKDLNSIYDLDTKTIYLGDVVICYDKVIEQAKKYNHSIKREFSFLFVHSLFHLLGYDHMNEKDEKVMFSKQENVLQELKINR